VTAFVRFPERNTLAVILAIAELKVGMVLLSLLSLLANQIVLVILIIGLLKKMVKMDVKFFFLQKKMDVKLMPRFSCSQFKKAIAKKH